MKKIALLSWTLILLTSCSHVFYQPDKVIYSNPIKAKFTLEETFHETKEGEKLHVWKFPVTEKVPLKGTVLFFHGNAQNVTAHFYQIYFLMKEGYQVYLWDYQGFGKSTGSPSQKAIQRASLEIIDEAYKWHKETNSKRFILWAQSLGGAIAIPAVAKSKQKENIDLLLIESSFLSYQDIAFDKLTINWITIPISPLAFLLVRDTYAPEDFLEELKPVPLLIASSTSDKIVPYKFSEKLNNDYQGPKTFWTYKFKRHIRIFTTKQEREKLISFFDSLKEVH